MRFRYAGLLSFVFLIGPIGGFSGDAVRAQEAKGKSEEARQIGEATAVVTEVLAADGQNIPRDILDKAAAIAVLPYGPRTMSRRGQGPNTRRQVFMNTVRARGIMSIRNESGDWLAPAFVTLNGGRPHAGDLVLVVMNRDAVDRVLGSAFKIESNIAPGPMAADAKAASSTQPTPDIFSYTRLRGKFTGVTLDANMFLHDNEATRRFYGKPLTGTQAIAQASGPEPVPAWRAALDKYAQK